MKGHFKSDRRNFLRGIGGAALALPWLESFGVNRDNTKPNLRAAWFYVPIGVVRRGFFPNEGDADIPKFTGSRTEVKKDSNTSIGIQPLELTPTLGPLRGFEDKVTLITGLDRTFQEGTDVHAQCASCFLTSAAPYSVKQSPYPQSRTLDHIVAAHLSKNTPFRTLEFSCNSHKDNKESIQFDNISWFDTEHVAPSMRDPRRVYSRLFGGEGLRTYQNITDLVLEDAKSMQRDLGYSDKNKFSDHVQSCPKI